MPGGNVVGIWHSNACHLAFDYWYLVFGIWQIWQIWQIDSVLGTEYFENIFDEQIFLGTFLETILGQIFVNILGTSWEQMFQEDFGEHFVNIFGNNFDEQIFCEYFGNNLIRGGLVAQQQDGGSADRTLATF